jgi:hypothetical protein
MFDGWFQEMNTIEDYVDEVSTIVIGAWKGTSKKKLEVWSQVSMLFCFLSMKFSNKIWRFNLVVHNKNFKHKSFKKQERKKKVNKTLRSFKNSQNLKSKIEFKKISVLVSILKWIRP